MSNRTKNRKHSGDQPAPPIGKRAENQVARRAAIVTAALDEFTEKGFAAARMEDVARRAGVAKGTIYLHFHDKEALFEGILRQVIGPVVAGVESARPHPGESARAFADRIIGPLIRDIVATRRADVVRLIIADGPRFPGLAELYYRVVVKRGLRLVRRIARHAAKTGELRDDALARFPQLLMAPLILGVTWMSLFERFQHLDVAAMFEVHLDLIFRATPHESGRG